MTGWAEFTIALATFFLSHSLPLRQAVRNRVQGRIGPRAFGLSYSILSLAVLVWLVGAAGRAPYVQVWPRAEWQTYPTLAIMLTTCVILGLSIGRPNPLSFGGPSTGFDATRPGIVRLLRHPVLFAIGLWATAHMLPNGDLAHVLLFGVFALFAFAGQRLVDRRKKRDLGAAAWRTLVDDIRAAPPRLEILRLGAGLALFAALVGLHPVVIGVSPLPR